MVALRQLSREAGAVRLCDLDSSGGMLTIECSLCRHGRYRLETLIEAYGPEAGRLLRPDTVEAGEQGGREPLRTPWREGPRPRGILEATARAVRRAGKA